MIPYAQPQAITIQIDPSPIMFTFRNAQIKAGKNKLLLEKYKNLPYPLTLEEAAISYERMYAIKFIKEKQKTYKQPCGSLKALINDPDTIEEAKKFTDDHVLLKKIPSFHNKIQKEIYAGLIMGLATQLPVYMTKMPEILFRMNLARKYTLEQMKGMLMSCLEAYKKQAKDQNNTANKKTLSEIFVKKNPDIAFVQQNAYLSALLREITNYYDKSILAIFELQYMKFILDDMCFLLCK